MAAARLLTSTRPRRNFDISPFDVPFESSTSHVPSLIDYITLRIIVFSSTSRISQRIVDITSTSRPCCQQTPVQYRRHNEITGIIHISAMLSTNTSAVFRQNYTSVTIKNISPSCNLWVRSLDTPNGRQSPGIATNRFANDVTILQPTRGWRIGG